MLGTNNAVILIFCPHKRKKKIGKHHNTFNHSNCILLKKKTETLLKIFLKFLKFSKYEKWF